MHSGRSPRNETCSKNWTVRVERKTPAMKSPTKLSREIRKPLSLNRSLCRPALWWFRRELRPEMLWANNHVPKTEQRQKTDNGQFTSNNNNKGEDHISPNSKKKSNICRTSQDRHAELCSLHDSEEITLMRRLNYTVAIIFQFWSWRICPVNCDFKTGTRPSLLSNDMFESNRISSIHGSNEPRMRSAINEKVKVVATIMHHIHTRETRVWVVFWILRNLAVSVFLGTFLVGTVVKGIFSAEKKIVPYNSLSV